MHELYYDDSNPVDPTVNGYRCVNCGKIGFYNIAKQVGHTYENVGSK